MATPAGGQPTEFSSYTQRQLVAHKKKIYSLGWNCKGDRVATGSVDCTAKIWNIQAFYARDSRAKERELELKDHADSVDDLQWHPLNGEQLATTSQGDRSVRLWDIRSAKPSAVVNTGAANSCLCWLSEGKELAVGSRDGPLHIIDVRRNKNMKSYKLPFEVTDLQTVLKADEEVLLAATTNGAVQVLVTPTMDSVFTLQPHTASCYCLAVDKQYKFLATSGADAVVTLWQLDELSCLHSFMQLDQPVRSMGFSHDSRFMAFAADDQYISIVHVPSGTPVIQFPTMSYPLECIAWHPHHPIMAYVSDFRELRPQDGAFVTGGMLFLFAPQQELRK